MSESNNRIGKTIAVAATLSIVCSIIVSTAATVLKPAQDRNKELDRRKNILAAAGLLQDGTDINKAFESVDVRIVDLESGEYATNMDTKTYDQRKGAKDPKLSEKLLAEEDIAGIGRREQFAYVYLIRDAKGGLSSVVLPIHGYGLWSTLYGFLALEPDLNTVVGLGFYDHAETPGLGGEVDNPKWKAQWPGKKVFDQQGRPIIQLAKGPGKTNTEVDGLSGATLTARGVTNLLRFWLGQDGFGPYLKKLGQTG